MKKLLNHILTPLLLTVLLLAVNGQAQEEHRTIRVQVPFEFTIGDQVFAAGQYSLVCAASGQLDLRDPNGRVLAHMITHSVQSLDKSASTKLDFSSVAGGHALRQVWFENETTGYELAVPKDTSAVAKRRAHEPAASTAGTK